MSETLSAATVSQQTLPYFQSSHILNRQEARSRLQKLTPGTEEHSKLQDALIRTSNIVEISLPTASYKVNTGSDNCVLLGGFGSSEHVAIGEAVELKPFGKNTPLIVRGVTPIRFQDIVALAGDFYGVPGHAISLPGGTDPEKTERFKKAFETLATADNDEVRRLLLEIGHECTAVKHSGLPHHCYSSHMMEGHHATKKIKKDIGELLIDNSDHFSKNAEEAYHIGHALAMSVAKEAGGLSNLEGLKRAYAIDAFACHFLTDLFAAGHIRNQRGELESFLRSQLEFSEGNAKKLAGILTAAQHEKDGNEGLNVYNTRGDHWRAYGDGCFFTPQNERNKRHAIAATQQSVNEIHDAYLNKPPMPITITQFIPHATSFNPPPIYSIIKGASLFLHRGSENIPIRTQTEYLTTGLSQALRYLPEHYITESITPHISIPPLVGRVIIPQVERLTGSIWHMVGLAAYYQVRQESQQLNIQINEMADVLQVTYTNSVQILKEIQDINAQLHHLSWRDLCRKLTDSIETIKTMAHQYRECQTINEKQQEDAERDLWRARIEMSSIFHNGTGDGTNLLVAYKKMLVARPASIPTLEATLWFRQMLDYQIQAFNLFATSIVMRNAPEANKIQSQLLEFESGLARQVEVNRAHIDPELICESQDYIALQLKKSKTKRLDLQHF